MTNAEQLAACGWCRFDADADVLRWVQSARPAAIAAAQDSQNIKDWLRCGDTWFAGVNALGNDDAGRVDNGPALQGQAVDLIHRMYGPQIWDRAQISVIYPGYPKPMPGESPAAYAFRRDRDAAHVDGLLPIGDEKRRHLHEPHGFVLGVPLVESSREASPMVVWEGSHQIMQAAFQEVLTDIPAEQWANIDLTDTYLAARRRCFDDCDRVVVHAQPGEAYLIHRLALHGVAPWAEGATAPKEGRMIAYFRPELSDVSGWLA